MPSKNSSVGNSYSILKGYRLGDPKKAQAFLNGLSDTELRMRNRNESKLRARKKSALRLRK